MANAIYTTTRDGLAGLVSRRVAAGMLSRAVASVGSDPTTIDAATMSRLLRGRVRRELERTLPRTGVRRRLADLDARLARDHGASAPPPPTTPARTPVRAATVWTHEPADTGTFDERRRAFPVAGDVVSTPPAVEPTAPTASHAATTPVPTAPAPAMPATDRASDRTIDRTSVRARPDRLIERITDDDAVRQWIWSPAHGASEGRGAGPDPASVASLLGSLTTVLGRHGAVRSLHVRHGHGHVMMGVDRGSTLVIAGDEDLNLGAVYASFRALEEES